MALHLVKLCVGVDCLGDLQNWQAQRLAELKKRGAKLELKHLTRQTPKRREELLDGGSLYWVIKGVIAARQALIDLRHGTKNGVPHCAIVYEPKLVMTQRRPMRPFQGWRYLSDPPSDIGDLMNGGNLPDALKAELSELGLL